MIYALGMMIYTIGSFTKAFVEVGFADVVLPMMATFGAMLILISTVFRGGNSLSHRRITTLYHRFPIKL